MTSQRIAQTNQQQKSEKAQGSGILQRAAVRSEAVAGEQSTDAQEAQALTNSAFSRDFSEVPISRTQQQPIQAKLRIGEVGDKYEREADRVASQVVQQINTPVSAQSTQGQSLQRQDTAEEEIQTKPSLSVLQRSLFPPQVQIEAKTGRELQSKSILQCQDAQGGREASTDLESAINNARGGGMPLDAGLQQSMGQAMGADFSGVKVHTDSQADQLNQSIQAKAFTTGQDVFFRQGEYNPGSRLGQELIAHELTHVVQQSRAATDRGRENPCLETTKAGARLQKMNSGMVASSPRLVAKQAIDIMLGTIQAQAAKLNYMYEKPGGWELWLQGELYYALTSSGMPVMAETSAYGTRQAADFTFAANGIDLVCELKCEGLHSQDRFAKAVSTDTNKLKNLGPGVVIQIAVARNITLSGLWEVQEVAAPAGHSLPESTFKVYYKTFEVGLAE